MGIFFGRAEEFDKALEKHMRDALSAGGIDPEVEEAFRQFQFQFPLSAQNIHFEAVAICLKAWGIHKFQDKYWNVGASILRDVGSGKSSPDV